MNKYENVSGLNRGSTVDLSPYFPIRDVAKNDPRRWLNPATFDHEFQAAGSQVPTSTYELSPVFPQNDRNERALRSSGAAALTLRVVREGE